VDAHDLAYTLNQVVHNFGAVAANAGAAGALWGAQSGASRRRLARLALCAWVVQAASGATFGLISYATFGQLPDIHGIAVAALVLKIACAAFGFGLCALYLAREGGWTDAHRQRAWVALLALAATALSAAALLRWAS
jgi:hypothetical protein